MIDYYSKARVRSYAAGLFDASEFTVAKFDGLEYPCWLFDVDSPGYVPDESPMFINANGFECYRIGVIEVTLFPNSILIER